MNQQLIDYIKKERNLNRTDQSIQESLETVGWKNEDISLAFNFIKNESNNDQDSNNLRSTKNRVIIIIALVSTILVITVYLGYVLLRKSPQSITVKPSKTTNLSTVVANPIIAYLESPPNNFAGNVVFYDTQKKQVLPPDPIIQSNDNSMFMLGSWSPNGQYLPILEINNSESDDTIINLYLYNSNKLQARRIYNASQNDENFVWASTSFGFLSGWIDDSRFVVQNERDITNRVATLKYFTIDGELKTMQQPDVFKSVNSQLSHTTVFNVDTKQPIITVGNETLNFTPKGTIVGVVDNTLITLNKPVSPSIDTDFENQLKEYEKQGMSQDELSLKMQDFLEPKGDTVLNFYNTTTGMIDRVISLTENTWQTLYVLVHPSKTLLVAHQTNKEFLPTKERFITIQLNEDPKITILFENDLVPEHDQKFSNRLLTQGSSFSLSNDGDWIIGDRGSIVHDPQKSIVFMHNIHTGEEIIVCPKYCSDIRTYYPYALQKRY